MARDVESLVLRMSADLRRFEKEMAKANSVTDRELTKAERRALQSQRNLTRTMGNAGREMVASLKTSLAAIAPTLAAAFSTQAVVRYADAWTAGRNALAAAGVATADLADRQSQLVDLASETRTGAAETIALYQRLSIATAELGMTQQDTLRLTELLNKSFQSSGLSTQEAASAALQLSQALASGTLQGDELRSLRENAPLVAKAIADAMGVSIGALKDLGAEGKITASVIVGALFGASEQINATFAGTATTVGQSLTILNNELGRFVGQADSGLSATERLAQGIVALANNLDRILPVAITLATLIGGRYALAMTAAGIQTGIATVNSLRYQAALIGLQARQTGATSAQIALNAAMAANPIGLVVTVVAALAAGVYLLSQRYGEAHVLQREISASAEGARSALNEYEKAAQAAAVATGENAASARENVAAMRTEAIAALQSAQALRVRTAALAASRAQQAQEAEARFFSSNGGKGAIEARGGQLALASASARTAERLAAAAKREADAAQRELARIDGNIRAGAYTPGAGAGAGGGSGARTGRGSSGASASRAAEAERERAAAEATRREQEMIDALLDAGERRTAARVAGQEREAALLRDRLETTAELARLAGDPAAITAAERELWINERINELLSLRPDLSAAARRAMAEGEVGVRAAAGLEGESRQRAEYEGREMARTFVDVLASDDIWTAAGNRFREAAFDNLEDLLSDVFTAMRGNGGGSGGIFAGLGNALKGLIPGFASGTSSAPGGLAYVHKGEVLANLPKGTSVIPAQVVRAMANMPSRASGGPGGLTVSINLEGANGDAAIRQISRQAAMEGTMAAIAQSRIDTAQDRQSARYRMGR